MRCDSLLINVKCTWIEVDENWCVFRLFGNVCVGCYAVNCFASSKLGFVAIIPLSCVRSMVTFIYSLKTYSYGIEI